MSASIPSGWSSTAIADLAHEVKVRNQGDDETPILSVTKYEGFIPSLDYFNKQVFSRDTANYKLVQRGQFAYATIHLDEGSIDLLEEYDAGLISPMYTVFEPHSDHVDPQFLLYKLRSPSTVQLYGALGQGSIDRRKSISFATLGQLRVALPPLSEQRRIAKILTSVDDAIAAIQAVIDQTRRVKQGLLQELLTRGIGHRRFKQTDIGKIPEGWTVLPLQKVCQHVRVGIASATTHAYADEGVPLLRNQNIREGYLDTSELLRVTPQFDEANSTKRLQAGDVLTIRTGYPGISAVVPRSSAGWQSFTTLVSRPDPSILDSNFLCAWINSTGGKRFVAAGQAGGAQQNLNAGTLKKMPVPLPSLEEQRSIARVDREMVEMLLRYESELARLHQAKTGLLQDLLTGRVRVSCG